MVSSYQRPSFKYKDMTGSLPFDVPLRLLDHKLELAATDGVDLKFVSRWTSHPLNEKPVNTDQSLPLVFPRLQLRFLTAELGRLW